MEKDKILIALGIFALALLATGSYFLKSLQTETKTENLLVETISVPRESIGLSGTACSYKNGVLLGCTKNRIVNTGEEWWEQLASTGEVGLMEYLALGNTTATEETDSSLPGEITNCGLTRAQASITDNGNANWTLKKTWIGENYGGTISCDNVKINQTGTYNASSSGTFIAGTTVADAIVSKSDNFTIEYTFTIGEE